MRREPRIIDRGGRQYVCYFSEERQAWIRMSLQTADPRVAKVRFEEWKYRTGVGDGQQVDLPPIDLSITEAIGRYKSRLSAMPDVYTANTIRRYESALRNVARTLGPEVPIASIARANLAVCQERRLREGANAKTVDYEMDVLRGMLSHYRVLGIVIENPAASGREHLPRLTRRKTTSDRRIFTNAELDYLLSGDYRIRPKGAQVTRRFYYLCNFLYYTGLRIGELEHLQKIDVDLKNQVIRIREKTIRMPKCDPSGKVLEEHEVRWQPKWRMDREVPVQKPLLQILRRYEAEGYKDNAWGLYFLTESGSAVTDHLSRQIKGHAALVSGKTDTSAHSFRHTHISHAVNRGLRGSTTGPVPATVVQHWVGHRDIETTMTYVHVTKEDSRRWAGY